MSTIFEREGIQPKGVNTQNHDRLPDEFGELKGFSDKGKNTLILATLLGVSGIGSFAADHFLFDGALGVEQTANNALDTAAGILEWVNFSVAVGLLVFVVGMLFFMRDAKGMSWPIYHDRD